ncbi:MAG: AMP-binding protein, partial [Burkholderiales bacterium]|nr:AMP-binding protein [Burkholderiales bacterium]
MTEQTEFPWIKHYSKGVPAEIDPDIYSSLPDFQKKLAEEYGNQIAFTNFGSSISYREFYEKSLAFASYLQSLPGVEKGDRVAVMMPNLIQYPVAVFGILWAGLIVVNINPLYTPRELEETLADSEAKVLVIVENFARTYEKVAKQVSVQYVITTEIGDLLFWHKRILINFYLKKIRKAVPEFNIPKAMPFRQALAIGKKRAYEPVDIENTDVAFLQYTGGTTGIPKGAMLTHRNIIANTLQTGVWISVSFKKKTELVLLALPLYHIFSLTEMCSLLRWGAELVLITNPRDIKGLVKEFQKRNYSVVSGVNTLFNALLHAPGFDKVNFKKLKLAVGGGTQIQKPVADLWHKLTGNYITEAYGLTEAAPGVSGNPLDQEWNGSVGYPLPSTEVSIRGEGFQDLGRWNTPDEIPSHTGEICVKGPQVMAGYWKAPDKTASAICDGWLRTGDVGHMNSEGQITITDRRKDMILVSGFNVYPNEVEAVVQSMPEVLECGVVGVP